MSKDRSGTTRRAFLATGAIAFAAGCTTTGDDVDEPGVTPTERSLSTHTSTPTRTDTPDTDTPTETTTPEPPKVVPEYLGAYLDHGEVIDDMSDLSDWSGEGTVRADEEAYFHGDQSLYYENAGRISLTRRFGYADPLDLTDRSLSFAAWLEEPDDALPTVTVFANAPDRHNRVRMTMTYTANKHARWQRYDVSTTAVEGSPDLSNVTELRFAAWADGRPFEFHIGDLRTHPKPDTGKVIFRFDDSHRLHYTDYYPILDDYGYPGIEAVVEQAIGGGDRLTPTQLLEMRDDGWDLCNHTLHHEDITELTNPELRANIEAMDAFFDDLGAPEGKDLAIYTFGSYDGRSMDVMADNFDLVFGGGGLGSYNLTNPTAINSLGCDGDVDSAIELVDRAAEYRSLAVPFFHTEDLDSFRELVDHVHDLEQAGEIEVITASDLRSHLYG